MNERNENQFRKFLRDLENFEISELVNFHSYCFLKPIVFSLETRNFNAI